MKNFVQEGDTISVIAPYALTSGDGCLVGNIFGVATMDAANGASIYIKTRGVFDLTKVSTEVWAVGDRLYWDNAAKKVTSVKTANTPIGVAMEITANPSTTGEVRIDGAASASLEIQAAVADLTGTLTGTANGSLVDIAATAAGTQGGSTPSAAQVDTGIATAVATIVTGTNEQLKELHVKQNAILAALRSAGVIAT